MPKMEVRAKIDGKWRTCEYQSKSGYWVRLKVSQGSGEPIFITVLISDLRLSDQAKVQQSLV